MGFRQWVVAGLALGSAVSFAAPVQRQAILWRGGRTQAEAKKWAAQWESEAQLASGLIQFPEGKPQVVKSDTLPGLNKGLYVVVLGICEDAPAEALLKIARPLYPGIYSRAVTVEADQTRCPAVEPGVSHVTTESVRAGTTELTLAHYTGSWPFGEMSDGSNLSYRHLVQGHLRKKDGTLGDTFMARSGDSTAKNGDVKRCAHEVKKDGDRVAVIERCETEHQKCITEKTERKMRLGVAKGRLDVEDDEESLPTPPCPAR